VTTNNGHVYGNLFEGFKDEVINAAANDRVRDQRTFIEERILGSMAESTGVRRRAFSSRR